MEAEWGNLFGVSQPLSTMRERLGSATLTDCQDSSSISTSQLGKLMPRPDILSVQTGPGQCGPGGTSALACFSNSQLQGRKRERENDIESSTAVVASFGRYSSGKGDPGSEEEEAPGRVERFNEVLVCVTRRGRGEASKRVVEACVRTLKDS